MVSGLDRGSMWTVVRTGTSWARGSLSIRANVGRCGEARPHTRDRVTTTEFVIRLLSMVVRTPSG